FMQWKQMDWPIMVDSLNLLGVKVVPITLFIDEHGIIRKVKPKHEDLPAFLATEYKIAEDEVRRLVEKPDMRDLRIRLKELRIRVPDSITKADYRDMADQMFLWFTPEHTEMVTLWQRLALAKDDDDGDLHFR